jgi:hypothetical protein
MDAIDAGLIRLFFKLGFKGFARFMRLKKKKSVERNIILKNDDCYFLDMIGVDPSCQNKGFASSIMKNKLNEIKNIGKKCYLETSNENNIVFYKKLGFEPIKEYSYDGLRVYCLLSVFPQTGPESFCRRLESSSGRLESFRRQPESSSGRVEYFSGKVSGISGQQSLFMGTELTKNKNLKKNHFIKIKFDIP